MAEEPGVFDALGKIWDAGKSIYQGPGKVAQAIEVGQPVKTEPLPLNEAKSAREAAINAGKGPFNEAVKRGKGM